MGLLNFRLTELSSEIIEQEFLQESHMEFHIQFRMKFLHMQFQL